MYLTYDEYRAMGGTLDATAFDDYEFAAEALVNWYTFNRLSQDTQIPSQVKRLVKYLIETAKREYDLLGQSSGGSSSEGTTAAIASQSNDGVSVSYNVLSARDLMEGLKTSERLTIETYLQGVMNEAGRKLLYRGLYPGE